jgi:D-alanyl-D-alanine carboxypeptidase/D-alanyl-D-alanine-endopeptidase (penicillin-binding protein 4)
MLTSALVTLIASQNPLAAALEDAIQKSSISQGATIGVYVAEADGTEIYANDADRRMIPASNQKLLSTAFAAETLGLDYAPVTRIWEEPTRIVIAAPGDPSMTLAKILEVSKELNSKTKPVFVIPNYAPGLPDSWEQDDLPNRFAAPVHAFSFDQSAFALRYNGKEITPLPAEFGIQVRTIPSDLFRVQYDYFGQIIRIYGTPTGAARNLDTLAFRHPHLVTAGFFGSSYNEGLLLPTRPADYTIQGDSLEKMLASCLAPSDNNYAEQLLLMGASKEGALPKGSEYSRARVQMTNFLVNQVGINPRDLRVYDGSGLSRHNLVTTRALAKLLIYSQNQKWGAAYEAGMARGGAPGTLRTRLVDSTFRGKTGTLDLVVGLSGFVTTKSGSKKVVSILINHASESSAIVRDFADNLIKIVESQ